MNKLAQVSAAAFIMAVIGFIVAWIMAGRMEAGIAYKIVTASLTGVAVYFMVYFITEQG